MTARVDCFIGTLRDGLVLPPLPLRLGHAPLERYLASAARDTDGRHLQVSVRTSALSSCTRPAYEETNIPTLETALNALFPGQPSLGLPSRVGIIFADTYKPRDSLLGLMFDVAPFAGVEHREGCAVFLDAIREFRKAEPPARQEDEIGFTTLHELGHCFNLWHAERPRFAPNFMASSETEIFDDNAWFFLSEHESYLRLADAKASVSKYVLPGGSPFDVRPNGWFQGGDIRGGIRSDPARSPKGTLQLRIRTDQKEIWHFDPLELEVELSVGARSSRLHRVPDEVDPGYDRFQIWIEEPDGRRRLYRAPVRYCANPRSLEIRTRQPFKRDVTIFAGAGGYTFRMPGEHHLSASFRVSARKVLWSNTTRVTLKAARPGLREFDDMARVLTRPRVGKFLFDRRSTLAARDVEYMAELTRRYPNSSAAASILFAVGAQVARESVHAGSERKAMARYARRLLSAAGGQRGLGRHRRRRIKELLDELE